MPVPMSGLIQSVEINGTVYVGGGYTDRGEDDYVVMAYNTKSCLWRTLSPYSTREFGMTSVNNKLVLVGGRNKYYSDSNELSEWQTDSNQWTHPFPPMSISRYWPSATSYKHWLVVAGGCHGVCLQTSVEILDVFNMQWSTGPSIPIPWYMMKSTTIGHTWYLMGGDSMGYVPDVYSVSLDALISHPSSHSFNVWNELPSLNCKQACPLYVGGRLLAVGGMDMKDWKPVSTIQCYVPESNIWVEAGQLSHTVYDCVCIVSSDMVYVMGGHGENRRLKELFTSMIS